MNSILQAAVYCGTYKKYNSGNLSGKWMKLSDYTTKYRFLKACAALHADENDPEFMFQDYENIPTSQVSESSISDEVWHTINSLKKYALERADEFAQWCEDNGAEQDYASLREFLQFKPRKASDSNDIKGMQGAIVAACNGDAHLAKFLAKNASSATYIAGKLVVFEKLEIRTKFCFRDEGADLERYKTFSENDFIAENLYWASELRFIDHTAKNDQKWYVVRKYYNTEIYTVVCKDSWKAQDGDLEMTPEQVQQYKDMLALEKSKFEGRLKAYLKRYGLSKIDKWTYWADA